MSRKVIHFHKILHEDKTYFVVSSVGNLIYEMHAWIVDIGDEGYIIDGELYLDEGAYMNLSFAYDGYDFIVK